MDIDPTKAPRTHATWKKAYNVRELAKLMVELSVQLEVELNVATVNEVFAENKVHILEKELEKANNRIKRLEEGGDEAICALEYASRVRIWTEAKEAKP
jgi:leucyl aminopeptidase (aminopeptidase T)